MKEHMPASGFALTIPYTDNCLSQLTAFPLFPSSSSVCYLAYSHSFQRHVLVSVFVTGPGGCRYMLMPEPRETLASPLVSCSSLLSSLRGGWDVVPNLSWLPTSSWPLT